MKDLIDKELKLAMHPTAIMFLFLSAMLLIPSYPYFIVFFYTCLGVFFICMTGRENRDIYYTMLLPVRKREIVGARFLLIALIEVLQFAIAVPFAVGHNMMYSAPNDAGMNVNIAFFGFAFLLLGLFNLVFFVKYYKNPNKVGVPFALGCFVFAAGMFAVEALRFTLPAFNETFNGMGTQNLAFQLAALVIGIALWAGLTLLAYRKSVRSFEAFDL